MNTKRRYNNLRYKFVPVIFFIAVICSYSVFQTKAMKVSNISDTISDARVGIANVTHNISWSGSSANTLYCIKVLFCTTSGGGCTVPSEFNSVSAIKENLSGLTSLNWVLDNTSNGILKLVNVAGESPTPSVGMEFSGITNPIVSGSLYLRLGTYSDAGCLAQVDNGITIINIEEQGISVSATVGDTTPPPPSGGGGQITPSGYATVVFKGKAYPGSYVTILKDGNVTATLSADPGANFEATLTGLSAGVRNFGLWSEDKNGVKSMTLSFSSALTAGTVTTFSGLFLPPTINIENSSVTKGEIINIFGYSYPASEVNIFLNSESEIVKKVTAKEDGGWLLAFDTSLVETGDHSARSKAVSPEAEISLFSQVVDFRVLKEGEQGACQGADLNFDKKIDLIDFSIMLYFWDQAMPSNICADINSGGTVNLVDFSIMMYYWTD
ncbi:hypothetical protein KAJ41_00890 [Candidatus Parcubacteria bacterium]|nr:hypothetical protein [Candidatus Parcubacteria bacterium]